MPRPAKKTPSKQDLEKLLEYDPDTGYLIWKSNHRRRVKGARAGSIDNLGYRVVSMANRQYYKAHRLVWKIMTGKDAEGTIDHINGDKDDNRWENLRLADMSNQNWNKRTKGYWKKGKRYQVRIRKHDKVVFDKTFATEEEAIKARDEMRLLHHGEYCAG